MFEEDSDILKAWQAMRSELWQFLASLINSLDVLTLQISQMRVHEIAAKQAKAYEEEGWDEPRFCASGNPVYWANCDILNQDDFIYSKSTMQPQPVITTDLAQSLKAAMEQNMLSPDLKGFYASSSVKQGPSS